MQAATANWIHRGAFMAIGSLREMGFAETALYHTLIRKQQ
jgi:hypothetical protein